ncbi:MAG: GNAT family N-acetyltransferase [Chloroflexota bacterium]|nr:GNAT family N-acetyltransferase [Chloroflexota bacterium]
METKAAIMVHDGAGDRAVRSFLDAEWNAIDPAPWTERKCVITAERNGTLIGVATCSIDAGVAHLGELMVTEKERHTGIGAHLLAAFEEWAVTHGAHTLSLDTRHHGPAQRFYERHGWRVGYVMENHYLHNDYAGMVKEPGRPTPAPD